MAMLAMGDPKLASMDPKMLQALGLGLDPKLLGMGGLPGAQTQDQKMLAALGMAGLGDPKTAQAQAQAMQAQAMQLQQQLAMSMGMGGLDAKALSALGMPGLDAASLAALTGMGGLDMKQMQLQQQQQQEAQTKALAQLMGGSIDPKLLGLGAGAAIPGLAGLDDATKKALGLPVGTPKPEEKPKSETPTPTETPKPPETEEKPAEKPDEDKPTENGEAAKPEENGETKENAEDEKEGGEENKEEEKKEEKDGEDVEEIVNTNDEKPETDTPSTSLPTPNLPSANSIPGSIPSSIPGLDAATMKALGSLGQMDPKTMKTNGLDPNLLKSLGIGAATTTTPTTSKPIPSIPGMSSVGGAKMPGMEGLDNETLKLLAQGDPSAMQKLMANPGLMGMDPRMMGLDMAALMGGAANNQAKQAEQQLMKQFGLDPQLSV